MCYVVPLTYVVQEIVGSLYLVPVEEVGLAELEVLEVVMLDEGLAGDIETREQPAPPRALLVGHWLALSLHFVVENVNIGLQTSDNECVFHYTQYSFRNVFHISGTYFLERQASSGSDLVHTF